MTAPLYTRQMNRYLNNGEMIRVYLTTGIGLAGRLVEFDEDAILIDNESSLQPTLILRESVMSVGDMRDGSNRGAPRQPVRKQ